MRTILDRPASEKNYTPGRTVPIDRVVLHVMEGSFAGTAAWFANPKARVSAHALVGKDGMLARCVAEKDTAWHATPWNSRSLGIEMEGFTEEADFPEPMLDSAAWICGAWCNAYAIPIDRDHIVGHCEVPDPSNPNKTGGPNHHTDPGEGFPWDDFINRVKKSLTDH